MNAHQRRVARRKYRRVRFFPSFIKSLPTLGKPANLVVPEFINAR